MPAISSVVGFPVNSIISSPITSTISTTLGSTISSTISSTSNSIVAAGITPEAAASRSISSTVPGTSSPSDSSSSGTRTGAIVGGVGAGIIAVAVIGFAVAFFFVSVSGPKSSFSFNVSQQRRARKRELDDAARFDVRDFRRSAVMLPDPSTRGDIMNGGYTYNPPMMMQRNHEISIPASPWSYAGSNMAGYGIHSQYQDASDHVLSSAPLAQTFVTASGQQFEQDPTASTPLRSPYGQSTSDSSVLVRQLSNNLSQRRTLAQSKSTSAVPHQTFISPPATGNTQIPADDYVDLSRSSVSPFQAVQYAEISRHLNDSSSTSSTIISPAQIYAIQQKELPPVPAVMPVWKPSAANTTAVSPFDDQEPSSPLSPQSVQDNLKVEAVTASVAPPITKPAPLPPSAASTSLTMGYKASYEAPSLNVQTIHLPASSTDSSLQEEFEFPVPPSPAISYTSRYRTDSLPHVLPEIKIQQRSSVSSYIPGSPMMTGGYISGMTDTSGVSGYSEILSMGLRSLGYKSESRFVPAPSPLASSFAVPTPAMEHEGRFAEVQPNTLRDGIQNASAEISMKAAGSAEPKNPELKRPETVYSPDDVYGGI